MYIFANINTPTIFLSILHIQRDSRTARIQTYIFHCMFMGTAHIVFSVIQQVINCKVNSQAQIFLEGVGISEEMLVSSV